MKAITAKISKTLTLGSTLVCNDNSGGRILKIIGVLGYKGVRKRSPKAGVGDVVICSVVSGNPKVKGTIVRAVIIRQKKEYSRPSGMKVSFEDNAAAVINEEGLPVGTEIKGAVAREVAERYSKVAAIAPTVL